MESFLELAIRVSLEAGKEILKIYNSDFSVDWKRADKLPLNKTDGLTAVRVVASRSNLSPETQAFIDELKSIYKEISFRSAGSSLKFCLVAEGEADVYPRMSPTME